MAEHKRDPQAILARFADGPAQLEAALAGLSDAELDLAPADGGWSIRQIAHHVADGDDLWKACIKAALGNSSGEFTLQWYWGVPQDTWAESWHYAGRAVEPSLALFRASRDHIVQLVERVPGAWERSIMLRRWDGQQERISVGDVIEMQAAHAMSHIRDILALRQAHRGK